jgi:hypothetical protein
MVYFFSKIFSQKQALSGVAGLAVIVQHGLAETGYFDFVALADNKKLKIVFILGQV